MSEKLIRKQESLIEDFKLCLQKKDEEIAVLKQKICSLAEPNVNEMIQKHLPMLTRNQIDLMTKTKKRVNYNNDELSKGFTMSYFNKREYVYLIKDLEYPLPSLRTLYRRASKMNVGPGILSDVAILMRGFADTLTEGERQVVLAFDEMACKADIKYHPGLDIVLGPHHEMQVVMVRGLMGKYKQPFFVDFDQGITTEILEQIITELSIIGYNVVAIVSDCGGGNVGLWKALNLYCSRTNVKNFFKHPITGSNIYVFADSPHLLKLLRNWFLDGGFVFADGTILKKHKVDDLIEKINTEISPGFKLSKKHLECNKTERMNVSLASQLFSHTTASCLRRYFPDDDEATNIANFIELVNQWFDVMNAYTPAAPWFKRPYGLELKHQNKVLDKMFEKIQSMKCYNTKGKLTEVLQTFQKGILMSIASLKQLYSDMVEKFGFEYLLTHRLNQDCLENFFSQVRGRDGFKEHPTPVQCLYNIRAIILGKNASVARHIHSNTIDQDPDEYVTSEYCKSSWLHLTSNNKEDGLQNDTSFGEENLESDDDDDESAEHGFFFQKPNSKSSDDGLEYIAGWITKKLNYDHPTLSRASKPKYNLAAPSSSDSWIDEVSLGGLTKPHDLMLSMVQKMENEFLKIHGETFVKQTNIRKNLISVLKQKFKEIPADFINLYAKSRIYFRCHYLNKKALEQTILERIEKRNAKQQQARGSNSDVAVNDAASSEPNANSSRTKSSNTKTPKTKSNTKTPKGKKVLRSKTEEQQAGSSNMYIAEEDTSKVVLAAVGFDKTRKKNRKVSKFLK